MGQCARHGARVTQSGNEWALTLPNRNSHSYAPFTVAGDWRGATAGILLALSPWTGTQARALPLGTDRVVRFRLGRSALGEDERRRCV